MLLNFNYYASPTQMQTPSLKQQNIENKRKYNSELTSCQNTSYAIPNPLYISTPIENKKIKLASSNSFFKLKQPCFDEEEVVCTNIDDELIDYVDAADDEEETQKIEAYDYYNGDEDMDESTQLNINAPPKLIESTFNSSSLSNMSNDLIILQHVFQKDATEIKASNNMKDGSYKRYVDF